MGPMTEKATKRWTTRYRSKKERLESNVLAQWYGGRQRVDTERCVSRASDHIDGILAKLGISEGIDEHELIDNWSSIVGDFIAKHTRPASLKKGILSIQVLQPAMRFHLEQSRGGILRKLRQCYAEEKIKNLRFILG
jgi:hypothetical protein